MAQTTEAEVLGRRVHEVEARMAEQLKLLSDREIEIAQLRDKLAASERVEAELRSELSGAAGRSRAATENLVKEKALLTDQLDQARAERIKQQQEIASMKREAEQTWAAERVENALLRERINDIAAEIARLTVELEGVDSPIEAMLAGETAVPNAAAASATAAPRAANGERKPAVPEAKGNLADRIRALQMKASRVPAPG
jgi:chromosome segregation ATPase